MEHAAGIGAGHNARAGALVFVLGAVGNFVPEGLRHGNDCGGKKAGRQERRGVVFARSEQCAGGDLGVGEGHAVDAQVKGLGGVEGVVG